jgi:hypothetical protein
MFVQIENYTDKTKPGQARMQEKEEVHTGAKIPIRGFLSLSARKSKGKWERQS